MQPETKQEDMENLFIQVPKSDMALISAFADRMGWIMKKSPDSITRFVEACRRNSNAPVTEEDIMEEVRQTRYGR